MCMNLKHVIGAFSGLFREHILSGVYMIAPHGAPAPPSLARSVPPDAMTSRDDVGPVGVESSRRWRRRLGAGKGRSESWPRLGI